MINYLVFESKDGVRSVERLMLDIKVDRFRDAFPKAVLMWKSEQLMFPELPADYILAKNNSLKEMEVTVWRFFLLLSLCAMPVSVTGAEQHT